MTDDERTYEIASYAGSTLVNPVDEEPGTADAADGEPPSTGATDDKPAYDDSAYDESAYDESPYAESVSGDSGPSGDSGASGDSGVGAHSAPRFERDRKLARRRKRRRIAGITCIVVIALLAVAWGAGAVVFSFVYYPNVTIMGADVSLMRADEAREELEEAVASYSLVVSDGELYWEVTAREIDFSVDTAEVAEEALASNEPLIWPKRLYEALTADEETAFVPADGTYPVSYDEEALLQEARKAARAHNQTRTGVFDSESAYDESAGKYTLAKALSNRLVRPWGLLAIAEEGFETLASKADPGSRAYRRLAKGVSNKQLKAVIKEANKIVSADFDIVMGDSVVADLDSSTTMEWTSFDAETLEPELDYNALAEWSDDLAESLTTVGTERTFTGSDGDEVTIDGGTYGWEVDAEEFAWAVKEAVAGGRTDDLEVPTTSEAVTYSGEGEADWGAYAEVDIGEQYAWYYDADGNLLWESGVITGNPYKGNSTPTGVYKINTKLTHITLRGDNYASKVTFWMAIVGSSVGFHDATWQSSYNFGRAGAQYSVGSHGCVNLPYDAAEELYDLIEVGDCVIIHE